jgi:hypothetical protein
VLQKIYSILISKVRRSELSYGAGTFDELIIDMLCLCKDSEASALAGELECCIRGPICVSRSLCTDLERSMYEMGTVWVPPASTRSFGEL